MPVFTTKQFNDNLKLAVTSITSAKAAIQECLIYACFYAFKDGNTSPLNDILHCLQETKAVEINRITKWVCLHAKIARVKDDKFVLNKKTRDESGVTDAGSFETIEEHLRALAWWNIEKKTQARNWELDKYLETVLKTLDREAVKADADTESIAIARKAIAQTKATLAVANYDVE